jgi:hypothetical protein
MIKYHNQVNFKVTKKDYENLKQVSEKLEMRMTDIARDALLKYLKDLQKSLPT